MANDDPSDRIGVERRRQATEMTTNTQPDGGKRDPAVEDRSNGHERRVSVPDRAVGPRYQHVRQDLLAAIRRGEYKPGDRLPSENQICSDYGVSVTTARRALFELVKEGIVFRQPGVGTMVAPDVRQMRLALIGIGLLGESTPQMSSRMGELIAGIGECAWERDASFSMTGLHTDEAETHLRRVVRDRAVDGVLLRCSEDITGEWLTILEDGAMPYVVIKRHLAGRRHNCVISDDTHGGWLATSYLLDHWHRRVGFVCAKPDLTLSRERLAGYRQALQDHQVPFDAALVRADAPDFDPTTGYRAVTGLLTLPEPPTAIFVASDSMALGAYEAIRDAGHQVGNDVAVVGYDDVASAALVQPPLTTIHTSYAEFGRVSAELLIALIDGRVVPPAARVLTPALVVRESAGEGTAAAVRISPEPMPGRQLVGRNVLVMGADGPVRQAIAERFVAEGALLSLQPAATRTVPSGQQADERQPHQAGGPEAAAVVVVDVGDGQTTRFDELLAAGHAMAAKLARQQGGQVLLVPVAHLRAGSGAISEAAVRGGVTAIVAMLGSTWATSSVRVNASVLAMPVRGDQAKLRQIAGAAVFFASPDAVNLRGETIVIR